VEAGDGVRNVRGVFCFGIRIEYPQVGVGAESAVVLDSATYIVRTRWMVSTMVVGRDVKTQGERYHGRSGSAEAGLGWAPIPLLGTAEPQKMKADSLIRVCSGGWSLGDVARRFTVRWPSRPRPDHRQRP